VSTVEIKKGEAGNDWTPQSLVNDLSVEKSRTSVLIDNAQKIVQVLAIVIAAVWALKEFYNFQDRTNALALELKKLNVEQAKLNAEQASIQREEKLLGQLQRINVVANQRTLRNPTDLKYGTELSIQLEQQKRFADGTYLYYVNPSLVVRNTSDESLEVSACTFQMFVGTLPSEPVRPREALVANPPPIGLLPALPGEVVWSHLSLTARVLATTSHRTNARAFLKQNQGMAEDDPKVGEGGCTGHIPAQGSWTYAEILLVRARPEDWVGASLLLYFGKINKTAGDSAFESLGFGSRKK